jgi:hypothetical protein
MAAGPCDGWSRRDDLGARFGGGRVLVTQRYREVVPIAQVSHRRDACPQAAGARGGASIRAARVYDGRLATGKHQLIIPAR